MGPRIVIGGIVGGILVFCMGAFNHMVLQLQGRTISTVPAEQAFTDFLKEHEVKHGIYMFPGRVKSADPKEQEKLDAEMMERFKKGPAGLMVIAPTGEDMMGPKTLGLELLTNIIAALIVSWIVSLVSADIG